MIRGFILLLLAGVSPAVAKGAGNDTEDRAPTSEVAPISEKSSGPEVARADLALAYLRFDRAFAGAACRGDELARVNQRFDAITRLFFFRRFAEAVVALNTLTESLSAPNGEQSLQPIASCSLRMEPSIWPLGSVPPPRLKITVMGAPIRDSKTGLSLTIRDSSDDVVWRRPLEAGDIDTASTQGLPLAELWGHLAPGRYYCDIEREGQGKGPGPLSRPFDVVSRPIEDQRIENTGRLDAISPATPDLARAIFVARARNALLNTWSGIENSVQLLSDPARLALDVSREIDAIAGGNNPYRRLAGDHWRVVEVGGQAIPVRLYAPIAEDPESPRPLLIALHGAGGDENLFMNGYGAGMIKSLAARHGFIVAAPLTYGFVGSAVSLDRLLADLMSDYSIDADRVYVLGHSLGAIATVGLATAKPELIAGACCVAGFRPIPAASRCAPLLVILAELDPIFPPSRIEHIAERARESGLSIEVTVLANQGHTLVMNEALPAAVEWLLAHRRSNPPAR